MKREKSGNLKLRLLFRNYIFVALEDRYDYADVQRTIGVDHVLTYYDSKACTYLPSEIDSNAVNSLRELSLEYDESNGRRKPNQYITSGCYVRIISGPLKDMPGAKKAFVNWADKNRARLLLEMFNGKAKTVEFYQKDLEIVNG